MKEIKKGIRIDAPWGFLDQNLLTLFEDYVFDMLKDPEECVIVNPGTEKFLDEKYFWIMRDLKVVGTPSTGVGHIDIEYLDSRGIKCFSLLDDRAALEDIHASAEFTWLHIMNAFRKFILAAQNVKSWRKQSNERLLRSRELAGKTIGIIGFGRIGRKVAKYAKAFSMKVKYYDPYVEQQCFEKVKTIEELKDVDILSINCYLTEETRGLISNGILDNFKDGLIVVNTSRGEVVDDPYIWKLLDKNKIFYAADVLTGEQSPNLLSEYLLFYEKFVDKVCITPHVAGATIESQTKALKTILKLCSDYLKEL